MTVNVDINLSAPVTRRLEAYGISHYLVRQDQAGIPPAQRVQAVWVEDAAGSLLVLYSHKYLLDLSNLALLTGRPLETVSAARQKQLMSRHELGLLSCLFLQTDETCLCEARLLEQPRLLVDFGHPGWLLELSCDGFVPLLKRMRLERFGIAVSGIQQQDTELPSQHRPAIFPLHSFTSQRICQRLEDAVEIPPMSQTSLRLASMRNNAKATVDDLTHLIETDPPLAAQVISWASAPCYAAAGKIRSVRDAIARALGFERVINLALGLSVGKSLRISPTQTPASYWHQAIYMAMVVDGLAQVIPPDRRPEAGLAYLAGLLHNFGYLILAHVFPPHFSTLCQYQEANPHLPASLVEHYLLGISREQIGAWLMQHWQMPEELVTGVYYQNDPEYRGDYWVYPNLICLATHLLRQRGLIGEAWPLTPVPESLLMRLGLTLDQVEEAVSKVLDAEAELRELARHMQGIGR